MVYTAFHCLLTVNEQLKMLPFIYDGYYKARDLKKTVFHVCAVV